MSIRLLIVCLVLAAYPSHADDTIDFSDDLSGLFAEHQKAEDTEEEDGDNADGGKGEMVRPPVPETKKIEAKQKKAETEPDVPGPTEELKKAYKEYKKLAGEVIEKASTQGGKAELDESFKKLAEMYVELHYDQRKSGDRKEKFVGLLGPIVEALRKAGADPARNKELGLPELHTPGGSALERKFEEEISAALDKKTQTLTKEEFAQGMLSIQADWKMAKANGMAINASQDVWQFAGKALRSVGMLSNIELLQRNGQTPSAGALSQARQDLASLLEDQLFSTNTQPRIKEKGAEVLLDSNQVSKWAKIYSIDSIDMVEKNPALRELLPEKYQNPETLSALKRSIQESLASDLRISAKGRQAFETDARGSSDLHSSMAFNSLAALPADLRNPIAQQYLYAVEKPDPTGAAGGKATHLLKYAPFSENLPVNESERSSSGRYVSYALVKFQTDPTDANREILLKAVENFHTYSGSLRSEVPRNGAHDGIDFLAPYYYHPGIDSVGKAAKELAFTLPADASVELNQRVNKVFSQMERTAVSSYDPETKTHLTPGHRTYEGVGPTFSAALSSSALNALDSAKQTLTLPRETRIAQQNERAAAEAKRSPDAEPEVIPESRGGISVPTYRENPDGSVSTNLQPQKRLLSHR